VTTIHDAIKILSELTEADLRSRLDQLAAEQQAAKVLLRAVVRRDYYLNQRVARENAQ
jgi:hypothetical protein